MQTAEHVIRCSNDLVEPPRILATIDGRSGYDGMIVAVRARVAEIGLNSRMIDDLSGLTPGYTGKLLGTAQIRQFGLDALLAISATLGLCFDVRIDPHQESLMRRHWEPGQQSQRRIGRRAPLGTASIQRLTPVIAAEMGRKGGRANNQQALAGKARMAKMTAEELRNHQSSAAKSRAKLRKKLMDEAARRSADEGASP
jgi:hypothetical protein